jgi:hypothetical protein
VLGFFVGTAFLLRATWHFAAQRWCCLTTLGPLCHLPLDHALDKLHRAARA